MAVGSKKRRRIRWGWIWVLVLGLAGGGFAWQQQQNAAKTAREIPKGVQVGRVERGAIEQKINATGVIAAQIGAKVNIGSEIAGRVRSLPADVGSVVRRNQVVAVIASPDLEAQVEQQQRSVEVARAAVAQSESRLRQAGLTAGMTESQTAAQIQEAEFAVRAAGERLKMTEANSRLSPEQTTSEIARAQAALSTARSQEKQTKATVALQIRQAQNDIDDAKAVEQNSLAQLKRRRVLLAEGYVARQEVENIETDYRRAQARTSSAQASMNIVREKTEADLQAARDRVVEAEAGLRVAKAGHLQDDARVAEMRNAQEAVKQAQATLRLTRTGKTQDMIRRREVEEARSALAQARANLRQSEAALRYQQAQLNKAVIRSPVDGTVLTVNTQQGETVSAGFQVQTLITVADLNRLEVRAYVDEVDISRVRLGLPAEVRVDSLSGRKFPGRVVKVSSASTVKDNVVTYETTVALDNPGGALKPDMTADVTLILGRQSDVTLVPSEAIHRSIDKSYVYVLHREKRGKERVEKRDVTVGVDDGSRAEIRSGVKDGEEVVLAGLPRLGVEAADAQRQGGPKKEDE